MIKFMRIPVCSISSYGRICGSIQFDTDSLKFVDSNEISNRNLPVQDYMNCCIQNLGSICTIVGKNNSGRYYCCFGDTMVYDLSKDLLFSIDLSNAKLSTNKKLLIMDKNLPDYSILFPDNKISFKSLFFEYQKTSIGVAKKFFASYSSRNCMVKFSKSNNTDLLNEVLYKRVSDLLNVRCCDIHKTIYFGKACVVSIFEYKLGVDQFRSFKSLNMSVEQIYTKLDSIEQREFDKMMILDFIMLQQDRHMSNIAICNNKIYPLFDNGECLGLGAVGMFSSSFRNYVMHLDKRYIKSLICLNEKILYELYEILGTERSKIVNINLKALGLIK